MGEPAVVATIRLLAKKSVRVSGDKRASISLVGLLTRGPSDVGSPQTPPLRKTMNKSLSFSAVGGRLDEKTANDSSGATAGSTLLHC